MTFHPLPHLWFIVRQLLLLALTGFALYAAAQEDNFASDPPSRVAVLSVQQGAVSFSPAGEQAWYEAPPNRPLTSGDRLRTGPGARAELYIGASALRMDAQTMITFAEVDDQHLQLFVDQGIVQFHAREATTASSEQPGISTPNLTVVIGAPGAYRVATDAITRVTEVRIVHGRGTLYGEHGESITLGTGQQATFTDRNLAPADSAAPSPSEDFERWVAERHRAEELSPSAVYISRELTGYRQLDGHGDWRNDPTYGPVWYPRSISPDWAPYSNGYWTTIAPWGPTWIDRAPWGFVPFHYGRWTRIANRWGWVPGRLQGRPVYAPALVGFVDRAGSIHAAAPLRGSRHGISWFPLAPGEAWRPPYRASATYLAGINHLAARQARGIGLNPAQAHALIRAPANSFSRGPIRQPSETPPNLPRGGLQGLTGPRESFMSPTWTRGTERQPRDVRQTQPQAQDLRQQAAQVQIQQQMQQATHAHHEAGWRAMQAQQQALRAQEQARQTAIRAQAHHYAQQQQQALRAQQEMQMRPAQTRAITAREAAPQPPATVDREPYRSPPRRPFGRDRESLH